MRLVMRCIEKKEGRPPLRWRANVRQGGVVIGCGKWLAEEG